MQTVFYDNDYRRMVSIDHKFGDAIPVPIGAMFLCDFPNGVPEDDWPKREEWMRNAAADTDQRGSATGGNGGGT